MVGFTKQTYGIKTQVNPYAQALVGDNIEPTTGEILGAYAEEGFVGSFTAAGTKRALEIEASELKDSPIDKEQYTSSPYYRQDLPYYEGITEKSAQVRAENHDNEGKRAFIISKANTAQDVAGFATTLGVGVFEPQNAAIGVATYGAGTLIGASKNAAKLYKLYGRIEGANKYRKLAVRGATTGLAGGAIQEPINRYVSGKLGEDYTMADSAMNFATSILFGAGFEAGSALVRAKMSRGKTEIQARNEVREELDYATQQVLAGQEVDINAIRAIKDGDISKKPIAEKTAVAERFMQKQERVIVNDVEALSTAIDSAALPKDIVNQVGSKQTSVAAYGELQDGLSPKAVKDISSPTSWVIRERGTARIAAEIRNPEIVSKVNTEKYEAVPITEHLANLNGQTYYKGEDALKRAEQVRAAAFGTENIDSIAAKITKENTEKLKASTVKTLDPANSTAFNRKEINMARQYYDKLDQYSVDEELSFKEAEIDNMREQGLLSEEDEALLAYVSDLEPDRMNAAFEQAYNCLTGK